MNPEKTAERTLVTGLNLETDVDTAMQQLTMTYERYSRKKLNAKPPTKGNKPVKAFHLIQSFAHGECSADEAHAIGMEWVRKAFGEDYQAMVCTHTDKDHIHNHVLLCPYSLSGKKFNSKWKTLWDIRNASDGICREHGIGIMEQLRSQPDHEPNSMSYGEWLHRKLGDSWKERIRVRIDMLAESASSLDDLLSTLEGQGYTIKRGKFISVKAPEQGRAVRLKTLGARYEESRLARRIEKSIANRKPPKSLDEIIDDVMQEYSYETRKLKFAKEVQDDWENLSQQLNIINSEQITSIGDVEGKLTAVRKKISEIENSIKAGEIEAFQIEQYSDMLLMFRQQERDYQSIADTYNESSSGDYISRMVTEVKARMSEQEKDKLRHLQEQKYEIYLPNDDNYAALAELKRPPTIDNYTMSYSGSWFDAEGESVVQKLESICNTNRNIAVGMIIKVGGTAYFVDTMGFKQIIGFEKPAVEKKSEPKMTKPRR
ncbi:relaxase/mobilization nuclease domain-containing protein [Ruminococcus albus]|uniref:Relaxase/Mobilisation nuclease domain-containing protein n=1 Tax=Ruminococcus albus TaxID=1264 RepID=A0A1H7NL10_RUMAL|nr:relaxase/mobilization nuclease domain-containing protein [Ruminococcus albus]SEL23597.1 Relaxase/Mobilisation nuclease domain-containing protein [Ruminococcus albus]